MAIKKTDIALQQYPLVGKDWKRAPGVKVTGDIGTAIATLTLDGTEATADVINLVELPDGCRVLPHLSKVAAEDPGTAMSFTVGDTGSAARYSTALDIAAGGLFDFAGVTPGALEPYLLTDNTMITATLGTTTAPTAGKKVTFYIAFVAQN